MTRLPVEVTLTATIHYAIEAEDGEAALKLTRDVEFYRRHPAYLVVNQDARLDVTGSFGKGASG